MNIKTDKVEKFQSIFDEIGTEPNTKDWELRIKLLQEELNELKDAFEKGDMIEVADAYGDILFLTIGGVLKHKIPFFEEIFNEICDSNLSKADSCLEDANKSIEQYSQKGIKTHFEQKDSKYLIKRSEDNKVLKSHKYKAVELKKYFDYYNLNLELKDTLNLFKEYIDDELILDEFNMYWETIHQLFIDIRNEDLHDINFNLILLTEEIVAKECFNIYGHLENTYLGKIYNLLCKNRNRRMLNENPLTLEEML